MIELSKSADDNILKMKPSQLTGTAKWKDIEDLINRWARRNPEGALMNEQWIKEARGGLFDKKYAKMKNNALAGGRLGIILHPELLAYIQAFYPRFLETKDELHEFEKHFPKFLVPEKN